MPSKTPVPVRIHRFKTAAFASLALFTCLAQPAHADDTVVRGAGAVGGALLGTETVLLGEALAGVRPKWAYWLGALAGASLGGYVGARLQPETQPEVAATLLGAGVLLIIPSSVWFGNLREPKSSRVNHAIQPEP
jgi:hypothetical protein